MSKKSNLAVVVPLTWEERAQAGGYDNPMKDPGWPKGCRIVDYDSAFPVDSLRRMPVQNQVRVVELDDAEVEKKKNSITHKGLKSPIYREISKKDGGSDLYHGHHRTEAYRQLERPTIPTWTIECDPPGQGEVDPRKRLNQYLNNFPPSLSNNKEDAVKYLNRVWNEDTYFDSARNMPISDKKSAKRRDKAIHAKAIQLLREDYSTYSPQAHGGIIKRFLEGQNPRLLKAWNADQVWVTLTGLGYLPPRAAKKKCAYDTKTHRIYGVVSHHAPDALYGSLIKEIIELKETWGNAPGLNVSQHLQNMKITMATYVEKGRLTKILDKADLDRSRQGCLDILRGVNIDTYTKICIDKVYFMHQLLQPLEPSVPIEYNWNATTQTFVKKP